jgi:hypothetical protein
MNFEHLCKLVTENWARIPNKKKAIKLVKYHAELLAWKKQKLKLGAIVFEIKEVMFHQTVLWEEVEIRYIKQDTTQEDERKVENILKRLAWRWDTKNILALIVVIVGILIYLWNFLWTQYCKYLPTLALRSDHYDYVLRYGFEAGISPNSIGTLKYWSDLNYWLVDVLTDFCTYFNIIF